MVPDSKNNIIYSCRCFRLGFPMNTCNLYYTQASPMAQWVKKLPIMQETWVWCQRQEDPLEEKSHTHSSILTWKIPWTEKPGRLKSKGYNTYILHIISLSCKVVILQNQSTKKCTKKVSIIQKKKNSWTVFKEPKLR